MPRANRHYDGKRVGASKGMRSPLRPRRDYASFSRLLNTRVLLLAHVQRFAAVWSFGMHCACTWAATMIANRPREALPLAERVPRLAHEPARWPEMRGNS